MARYTLNIGDRAEITSTITTSGAAIDPTTVKAWTCNPSGTVTTYIYNTDAALTKMATGHYKLIVDVDTAGTWYAGFYSTGTGKASSKDVTISVEPSQRN